MEDFRQTAAGWLNLLSRERPAWTLAALSAHKRDENILRVAHSLVQHSAVLHTDETDRWQNTHAETHTTLSATVVTSSAKDDSLG